MDSVSQPGDIMIGVMLPIHMDKVYQQVFFTERPPGITCTMFHSESFEQFQALRFAVEEINRSHRILPNITLGFQVYDSCAALHQDLDGTLRLLTGAHVAIPNYRCLQDVPLSSIIGHSVSTHSILLAHILGLYRYPQISYFSTSPLLSDRVKFPSFFRTVPSDAFQSRGLAQLVLRFGWMWLGLVAVNNDYGQEALQLVKREIVKAGACVAFTESIIIGQADRNAPRLVKVIKESTATVVLVLANEIDFLPVLEEMLKENLTGKIFVASESWSTSSLISRGKSSTLLSGTIGLALHDGTIPGFESFLSEVHPGSSLGGDWVELFWEEKFGCKFPDDKNHSFPTKDCTGAERLDMSQNNNLQLRVTYNVYAAVHAVANTLNDLRGCRDGEGPFHNGSCADLLDFKPYQLLHYMKKVRVTLSSGRELYFDENGDPPATYDIVNWQLGSNNTVRHVKVGSYDTTGSSGQVFTINTSAILWATGDQQVPVSVCSQSCPPGFRKAAKNGEPVCCFHCVPCPQGEISNNTDMTDCHKCAWDEWPNPQKSRCLPKPVEYLSYDDPLGKIMTSMSIVSSLVPVAILRLYISYKTTPIVKANNYSLSCLLLLFLSFCFLCSLAFIGYPQPEKCLLRQVAFGMVFTFCMSCILAKTLMVVFAFMATKPNSTLKKWTCPWVSYIIIIACSLLQFILCIVWLSLSPPFPDINTQTHPGLIIVECNEGSPAAFWSMLGYLGLLASTSFVVAFLARGLPDSFNEAKFITFSMLAFLSVWLSYIPASLSTRGKYTVAMEIFAIQSSSWALVICMFLPKCFVILVRPNLNSRECLLRNDMRR
ncbi:extracellular calcium-sensing receptor-like [Spea bombifrons]|uniref:extracellular calcium-sensing receptor-like n=1 Tax=Spea bombifrons TaxID=233779 RepID=UPI00234A2E22|nr:extracellular calcium-sensing receptor-like [Spea bombifrons]